MNIPGWLLTTWEKRVEAAKAAWDAMWTPMSRAELVAGHRKRQRAAKFARLATRGNTPQAHRRRRRAMQKHSRRINAGRHPKSGRAQ